MSLVAYDSSDESEEELSSNKNENLITDCGNAPLISKKQRETVRITIPSMKKFDEESEEVPVKKPKLQSGSGLFSLLPPPKYSSPLNKPGFIPKVLTKKKDSSPPLKHISSETKLNKNTDGKISVAEDIADNQESEDSDHETSELDSNTEHILQEANYFSLDCSSSQHDFPNINHNEIPSESNIDEKHVNSHLKNCFQENIATSSDNNLVSNIFQIGDKQLLNNPVSLPTPEQSSQSMSNFQSQDFSIVSHNEIPSGSNTEKSFLTDEGFRKLQGRHLEMENIDIIDVNADDQLTSKNEWLMKSLTEEKDLRPARKKHNMPTQQQKRKHQITYLAFQAKERELDLKNQWALNSRTRRETQAKYGF